MRADGELIVATREVPVPIGTEVNTINLHPDPALQLSNTQTPQRLYPTKCVPDITLG